MKTEDIQEYERKRKASKPKSIEDFEDVAYIKAENRWLRDLITTLVGEKAAAVLFGEEDV